jgi:hypothetical protein
MRPFLIPAHAERIEKRERKGTSEKGKVLSGSQEQTPSTATIRREQTALFVMPKMREHPANQLHGFCTQLHANSCFVPPAHAS